MKWWTGLPTALVIASVWTLCGAGLHAAAVGVAERETEQPEVAARDGAIHTPNLTCRAVDAKGQPQRSKARRDLFRRLTGYPKGRPGYVVDHIVPLAAGGCDVPANMAWQRADEGKAKDAWELNARKWQDGTYLRLLQSAIDGTAKAEATRRRDIERNRKR